MNHSVHIRRRAAALLLSAAMLLGLGACSVQQTETSVDPHAGMVEAAAEQAGALLQQDPALAAPQHAALRHEVSRLFAQAGGFAIN